jgi:hypothetical protein
VIVRLDYQTQEAHICVVAWPRMAAKMERLYGPGRDRDSEDCARRWTVPLRVVSFRKPNPGKRRIKTPVLASGPRSIAA